MNKKYFSLIVFTIAFFYLSIALFAQNEKSAPFESGYAPVNGLELYYEIHGKGEPLVLLHGGFGAIEMFGSNLLPAFAEHHQVIGVDLQGHGRTADIDRPITAEFMAEDIVGLMEHLKIDKANFVGYSLGGWVCLKIAIKKPELINKLVIISSPFKRNGFYPEILAQQDQMGPESAEFLKQTPMYQMYASIAPKPEDWKRLVTKMSETIKRDFDWSEEIKTIKVPTMLVAGDADIFPPSHAVEFFNLLGGGLKDGGWDGSGVSNARLAILPGLTHYNIFMKPELAETILPFLESTQDLTVTRIFNAPVEEVWKAWSESEYVKQWWGPTGFTCPVAEMDFREGGKSLVCMSSPQYGEFYNTWTYKKIIPNESIEFILNFTDKDGNKMNPQEMGHPAGIPEDVPHLITFKEISNGKTELTVTEFGYTSDQVVDMSKTGLEQCLDKMAAIFEKE